MVGLPIGAWTRSHAPLKAYLHDAMQALGARGVVQPAFISKVISEHQSGHAAYWGSQIWVLSHLSSGCRRGAGLRGNRCFDCFPPTLQLKPGQHRVQIFWRRELRREACAGRYRWRKGRAARQHAAWD